MASEVKIIKVYETDRTRLWNLKNAERKSLADVVKYLLDKENARQTLQEE